MANQSVFGTTMRLTTHLPLRERAAWLFLSALADVVGAVTYRSHLLFHGPGAAFGPRPGKAIGADATR